MNDANYGAKLRDVLAAILLCAFLAFALLLTGCASAPKQPPILVNFPVRATPQGQVGSPPPQPPAEVQVPQPVSQPQSSTPPQSAASSPSASKTAPAQPPGSPPPIEVPVTKFNVPDNTPQQLEQPTDKQLQTMVSVNNMRFEVRPEQEDYRGGAVVYNYVPNTIYELFVAPLQLTVVLLDPGETLVSAPAAGDTSNFMCATTLAVQDSQKRQELLIKAVYAGKQTTIAVNTDKHSYFFRVTSFQNTWMPLVSFNYPLDFAQHVKEQAAEAQNRVLLYNRVTDLWFAYSIVPHTVHKPQWCPDIVFSDGARTYMSFPSASRASYAPVLFEVNSKGERELLNYRVVGSYYLVDRCIASASQPANGHYFELVLDINEGNIIDIIPKEE